MNRFFCLLLAFSTFAAAAQTSKSDYNKVLADSLGADEYGMKIYQFVILKTGTASIANKDSVSQIFKGHMENINKLVKENHLIVAGPFGKNDKQYRGLFIFKAKDKDQAEKLLLTDPAIKTGLLTYEIFDWYGSAALPMYLHYSDKITKTDF
ncbi:YciI family protein [Niabella ginsengisoli]|uniref:YciI family protein n=1 Tax=Niabella ginsengisoli TaxID=522298 RepID=A0ABS9SEB7_9BACT|nr:YciI family protein [Niabella ginsengisoli]MCH5596699.1 YciI family protein [Niabella ginsengisoli]